MFILTCLGILLVLFYVFLARVFYNVLVKSDEGFNRWRFSGDRMYSDDGTAAVMFSAIFPLSITAIALYFLGKLPVKLADFACNPQNFKFRVKIERRG